MNWFILIPIIVGLVSALLGYLIGKLTRVNNNDPSDNSIFTNKISRLESELKACKSKKEAVKSSSTLKKDTTISTSSLSAGEVAVSTFNGDVAKAVFGKKIIQDDLKLVEGIGPKIAELFHNNDIKTWKALSETSVDKCKEVLLSGGDRFKMHIPRTWPAQAKFAYEGKWAELLKWQNELHGGK